MLYSETRCSLLDRISANVTLIKEQIGGHTKQTDRQTGLPSKLTELRHLLTDQTVNKKTYCQEESGNGGKTIWQLLQLKNDLAKPLCQLLDW